MEMDELDKRRYVVQELSRYWPNGETMILDLPIPSASRLGEKQEPLPPRLLFVDLPDWSKVLAVNGQILVPEQLVIPGKSPSWCRTDWFAVIFWYLNGMAERAFEKRNGPIHSYSLRLKGWDPRLWERAWVNRIALFLRRWAAQRINKDEATLLGPLSEPEIVITHDLDAVHKTLAIRFKQTAFYGYNAARYLLRGNWGNFLKKSMAATRFFFSKDDYNQLRTMTDIEEHHNLRSHINVYGGPGGWRRSLAKMLFDPAYSIQDENLRMQLCNLSKRGWTIGLHQSFHTWKDVEITRSELLRLEKAIGHPITSCRQHWLRFSWRKTWKVQDAAGLKLDTTLGFNDRPGFRNGTALCFHPWDDRTNRPIDLEALPLVLMDSQLYDYLKLDLKDRKSEIRHWIEEIRLVRGTASVLWHPHTMSDDFGWAEGFECLLSEVTGVKRKDNSYEGQASKGLKK